MDIQATVIQTFNRVVSEAQVNTELKRSLRTHPKTQEFLRNITNELVKVHALRMHQGKKALKAKTIVDTIEGLTKQLILGIEMESERRYESEMQKIIREQKLQRQKDLEASSEGELTGEFEELSEGVIVGDTKEQSV